MLLSIQFPLSDSRAFLPQKVNLLDRPTWPSPSFEPPVVDFVRSFGAVRKRRLGGLLGWVGESALCEATQAIKFTLIKNFKDANPQVNIPFEVGFRRFYFDGLAVGKFETGLVTKEGVTFDLTRPQTQHLIEHFLKLPVRIPPSSTKDAAGPTDTELVKAGPHIARLYSASTVSHPPNMKLEDWWVIAGVPLLILVHNPSEKIRIPYLGKVVPRNNSLACDLSYYEAPYAGTNIPMWVIGLTENTNYRDVRALKICLLRLHAEFVVLRHVARNIAAGKIQIAPRTNESNLLQVYLNGATRRISRLSTQADFLSDDTIAELARESEDMMNPGERDELLAFLKQLGIRKNIFYKVEQELKYEIHAREVYMEGSSKFHNENSTIGVQGDNATVHNLTQVSQSGGELYANWSQAGGKLDELAQELGKLKAQLKTDAEDAEQFEAAASVAKAEDAAKKNDGPKVFEYLKTAGTWALETATKIGSTVAVEALKKSLGL
jgi:hypothetical protein